MTHPTPPQQPADDLRADLADFLKHGTLTDGSVNPNTLSTLQRYIENRYTPTAQVERQCEVFIPLRGYEGTYEISNFGNVKSLPRSASKGCILKPSIRGGGKGYYFVCLRVNGGKDQLYIHRLVAENFISNPLNKKTVNHKNGNTFDNRVSNLEWATHAENSRHARATGLNNTCKENTYNARLTVNKVENIKHLLKSGVSQRAIARLYGVAQMTICDISTGKTWKDNEIATLQQQLNGGKHE